ncbi:murein biosynthesis integral membrane protein MurJ [Dermacoccaceae bacterium W4C1]
MTERPSLGQLYDRPQPSLSAQHEMAGSLGEQFSSWIAQDEAGLAESEQLLALADEASAEAPNWAAPPAGRLGQEWIATHADSFARSEEVPPDAAPPEVITHPEGGELRHRPGDGPTEAQPPQTGAETEAGAGERQQSRTATAPAAGRAGLARSSALMAAGTLVSRLLGFLRGALQAAAIGVTLDASNAWATANTLPNIIYLILAGGVINAVLVPQITKSLRHADGGKGYTDRLLTLGFSILAVLTVLCVLAAPLLYRLYDLQASEEKFRLGWSFALISLPQIFFYGMYALLGQVLNARSRFGAYMWAPAIANVVAIAGLVYFLIALPHEAPLSEWDSTMIWVLAGSATLGIVLQALVLVPVLIKDGYRFTPNFHFRGVGLRSASTVALWAFAAVLLQQLGLVITTNVLNVQPPGEPGKQAQEFAFLLFMLPHSLITVSLVTALFTRMSHAANQRNHPLVRRDVREGLRLIGVATIPASIGAIVLCVPMVSSFYGSASVWAIGSIMVPMMLGLTAFGLCVIVQRAFYAYEDAKTPFRMQVICTAIAAVITLGSLLLPAHYVGIGIGLSLTLSNAAQGWIGLRWLQRRTGRIMLHDIIRTYVRLLVAALLAAVVTGVLVALMRTFIGTGQAVSMVQLLIGGVVYLLVFVRAGRALRIAEIEDLLRPISARLGRLTRR